MIRPCDKLFCSCSDLFCRCFCSCSFVIQLEFPLSRSGYSRPRLKGCSPHGWITYASSALVFSWARVPVSAFNSHSLLYAARFVDQLFLSVQLGLKRVPLLLCLHPCDFEACSSFLATEILLQLAFILVGSFQRTPGPAPFDAVPVGFPAIWGL